MKYAIEIEGLTKSYHKVKAVDNLDLHVPEGKIYGFLGKNGAGKTTTLRMIIGLIKPDSGKIKVFGRDASIDRLWIAGKIGSIIETPGFYENLTAYENLEITSIMFGVKKSRIEEVLEIVELGDTGRKKVGAFSLGMKQRLGIANALVHAPSILILDEPTNGMDPAGIKSMRMFLRKLTENSGLTVLISSHILSEVQLIADYVGIIDEGRLIDEISIQQLDTEGQSCLIIEVDDEQKTANILNQMKIKFCFDEPQIKVFCDRELNSLINKKLVENEISVNRLSPVSKNLEERFLMLINQQAG